MNDRIRYNMKVAQDNKKMNLKKYQVFTPRDIAETMLDMAGYKDGLFGKKILENSFGTGKILCAILDRYIKDLLANGLSVDKIAIAIERDIRGFEIDSNLYQKAIDNLNKVLYKYKIPKINWSNLYNTNVLFNKINEKFDFIIGNPPYMSYKDISVKEREKIKKKYQSCKLGKFDYCYAFIELSINHLNETGKLIQLIPNNIYKNVYGKNLRELLKPKISSIWDYKGESIFKGATTSSSIFLFDRSNCHDEIYYYSKLRNGDIENQFTIKREQLGEKWIFNDEYLTSEKKSCKLIFGDLYRVSSAVATLCNSAFLLREDEIDEVDKALVMKAASPKGMKNRREEYIIFPYYYENGKLCRISEEEFCDKYYKTKCHLIKFKDRLSKRKKDKNASWFEYGRSQALNRLHEEKILISSIITNKVETYKLSEYVVPYAGFFITQKRKDINLDKAQEILQSHKFYSYVQNIGVRVSGKSLRITSRDIENYDISGYI